MESLQKSPETSSWNPRKHRDKLLPGPGLLVSRGLIYLTLIFLAGAALWATITEMDVVINARGRLVVQGTPIKISAPEAALVVDVPVRVGQRVNSGDVLMRLDAFTHRAEAERTRGEIAMCHAEIERHYQAAREIESARAPGEAEREALKKIRDLITTELEGLSALQRAGIAPAADVKLQKQRLAEMEARLARVQSEVERHGRDAAERRRLAEEAEARIDVLSLRLDQLREYERRSVIRAPIAGVVTHLAVLHPGSMIGTRQPAVVLVPRGQPLLASVDIPNASMRRLRRGMVVRLELDAFPQEDFGYVEGMLLDIEPDADQAGNYRAWVSLGREEGPVSPLLGRMKPGLLADARIVVERRSVMGFLFRPLKRLGGTVSVAE